MSSEADPADPIVAFYDGLFMNNCCIVAMISIVTYSWLTSLSREVNLFWKGPSTGARVLYFSSRYIKLLGTMFSFVIMLDFSDETCATLNHVYLVLAAVPFLVWATFSGLRVYALTKRYAFSTLIFLLSIIPFVTNVAQIFWEADDFEIAPMGCFGSLSITDSVFNKLVITTRTCVIAADLLVILSTWWAMPGRSGGLLRRDVFNSSGTSLFGVFFRDGMMYFLILLLLNSIDIGLVLPSASSGILGSDISVFIDPFTSVLVSTFLLDLQEAHQRMCRVDSDDPLYSERNNSQSLVFSRVIGSLGASTGTRPRISPVDDFGGEDGDAVSDSGQQEDYVVADELDPVVTDEQDRTEV